MEGEKNTPGAAVFLQTVMLLVQREILVKPR